MAAAATRRRALPACVLACTCVVVAWTAAGAEAAAQGVRLADAIVFPPLGSRGSASTAPGALNEAPGGAGFLSSRAQLGRPLGRATGALRGVAKRLRTLVAPPPSPPAAAAPGAPGAPAPAPDVAGNLLLSPLSVAAAVGQLLLGARGETRMLLADLLDAPGPTTAVPKVALGGEPIIPDLDYHQQFKALLQLLSTDDAAPANAPVELHLAHAFFAQRGLPLRSDFQHALYDLYHADVRPLDFRDRPAEAVEAVNAWANRATRGRIPSVLSQPLPPSTAALVASAVYFRGAWEWPFDTELSVNGWFKMNPRRRVAARFMRGHFTDLRYYDYPSLGYRLVVLPYKGGQTAMYVALPEDPEVDLRTFAAGMSLEGLMGAARSATPQKVTLVLPRMTMAGSFSLKEPLSRLRRTARRRLPRSPDADAPSPRLQRRAWQVSSNHILALRSDVAKNGTREHPRSVNQQPVWASPSSPSATASAVIATRPAPDDPASAVIATRPAPDEDDDEAASPPVKKTEVQKQPNVLAVGQAPWRPKPAAGGTLGDAFDDVELDLTGASNSSLRVSDALHHVWIEVTETGTEAAAVTTSVVDYSSDDQLVVVDRPFVLAIVHEPTGALLFWASVSDPTGGAGLRSDVPAPTAAPGG